MTTAISLPFQTVATAPVLPAKLLQGMTALYEDAFNDLGGGGYRRIKVRKLDFALVDSGVETTVPNGMLDVVILGAAPHNHAVWYDRPFTPGQEPAAPDLVWIRKTEDTFPDALPVEFRKKVVRDGRETWAFQILRRVVFAVVRPQPDGSRVLDLDNPYIMDLSSMSLYGKGNPQAGIFKFSGLYNFCQQMGAHGYTVTPGMFLTKIVMDSTVSVAGVVSFQPVFQNGTPAFLDVDTIQRVYQAAVSPQVKDMLTVRERLAYSGSAAPAAPVATAAFVPPVAPAPVVAPTPTPVVAPMSTPVVTPAPVAAPAPAPAPAPVTPPSTPLQAVTPEANASPADLLSQAAQVLGQPTEATTLPPDTAANLSALMSSMYK